MGKTNLMDKKRSICVVLLVAFLLRLVIINQSLWLDEAIGAIAVRDFSYKGILTDFIRSDNHTPLYYLVLKGWTGVFGYSETSLRFPSVIFGVASVYLVYLIGITINNKDKAMAFYASVLMALSQFHIYYSQEARMYMMACFFASLTSYAFLKTFSKKKPNKYWLMFSLALAALIFSDYVPAYMLPVFWIYAIMKKQKRGWWKGFMFGHVPLFIAGLFWLPTFLHQSGRGKWLIETLPAWKTVAGGATVKQAVLVWMKFVFGRISLANKEFYYLLVIVFSIPVLVLLIKAAQRAKRDFVLFVWLWLVAPLVLVFLSSFVFPAFIYFRFTFVVPAFYLLLAWGLMMIRRRGVRNLLFASLVASGLISTAVYYTDHKQQREQWRQAVAFIERRAGENDVVIFEFPKPFAPYLWYQSGVVESVGATDSISANEKGTKEKTRNIVEAKGRIYHFNYLREITDPNRYVEVELIQLGYEKQRELGDYWGVGMISYWTK